MKQSGWSSTSDPVKAFQTYLNYLEAFCRYVHSYGPWTSYGEDLLCKTKQLQGATTRDTNWIRSQMRLAWNTEHLLRTTPSQHVDLLRISNQWAPVQAYYAVYCSTEAVLHALDGDIIRNHAGALRKIQAYFAKTAISPWNVCFTGASGRERDGIGSRNLPEGLHLPNNLQRNYADPLAMIGTCLRAEHGNRINDDWDRTRSGCRKYAFDPGPTGLLHFLYRLRIRANYRDVDVFLADAADDDIVSFRRSLQGMCFAALLTLEVVLIRKMKKKPVRGLMQEYLQANPEAKTLEERCEFYGQAV